MIFQCYNGDIGDAFYYCFIKNCALKLYCFDVIASHLKIKTKTSNYCFIQEIEKYFQINEKNQEIIEKIYHIYGEHLNR
jgi:hypothetical protein